MERGALQRPSPLWTVQDLAAYLNVSPRTVETLIADGAFRPIWVGRQRRFQPQAIEAYLRRQVG
jgi:excisionase family DNA binding protein